MLFLTVRSGVEKEAGRFVVLLNNKKWRTAATADGTARIRVPKKDLRNGRNTVRVRFLPADAATMLASKTRKRHITVAQR